MNDWSDLLTTALLGTGRRPLPGWLPEGWGTGVPVDAGPVDPAVRVLDLAARHRAVRRASPASFAGPAAGAQTPAPPADRTQPPDAAVEILGDLLVRPNPDLINAWLARADIAGCAVPAVFWTRLARLAAHATAYDRRRLGRALGARGRWFLDQNPDWRRLAADCAPRDVDSPEPVDGDSPRRSATPAAPPSPETVRAKPMTIFNHPDPWPDDVVAAGFAVVGSAALGRKGREFGGRFGGRLPVERYRSIAAAAEYYLLAPEATPAQRRLIKESFVIMEQAAFARVQIERAFAPVPAAAGLSRVEVPDV